MFLSFQIVEIKDEAVLKLNLTIYNGVREGDKYSDMSCVDASVDVQLGCIRGVFLRCFVNDLNVIHSYTVVIKRLKPLIVHKRYNKKYFFFIS